MGTVVGRTRHIISGQLASAATLFMKFIAGTGDSDLHFWPSQPIEFVLTFAADKTAIKR